MYFWPEGCLHSVACHSPPSTLSCSVLSRTLHVLCPPCPLRLQVARPSRGWVTMSCAFIAASCARPSAGLTRQQGTTSVQTHVTWWHSCCSGTQQSASEW